MTAGEKEYYVLFVWHTVCLTTCKHCQQIKCIHFFHNKQAKLSTDNKYSWPPHIPHSNLQYVVNTAPICQCFQAAQVMLYVCSASGMLGTSISCCQQAEFSHKMSKAWICTLSWGTGETKNEGKVDN